MAACTGSLALPTALVDPSAHLYSNFAWFDAGTSARYLDALTRALEGRVWQKAVSRGELDAARAAWPVISTRLLAGRTLINVVSDDAPAAGFAPVEATLEDVYFAAITGQLNVPVGEAKAA